MKWLCLFEQFLLDAEGHFCRFAACIHAMNLNQATHSVLLEKAEIIIRFYENLIDTSCNGRIAVAV
jgi:hypothetical protein